MLAHSPKFQALIEKSRRQIAATGGIPHDVFWREVESRNHKEAGKVNGAELRKKSGKRK